MTDFDMEHWDGIARAPQPDAEAALEIALGEVRRRLDLFSGALREIARGEMDGESMKALASRAIAAV